MSVNKVNKTTGELVTLANGTRMWIGTQSARDAAIQAGTMPNNCMVCITDDYEDSPQIKYKDVEVTLAASQQVAPFTHFKSAGVSSTAGNYKVVSLVPKGSSTDVLVCAGSVSENDYGTFYVYGMSATTVTITVGYYEVEE